VFSAAMSAQREFERGEHAPSAHRDDESADSSAAAVPDSEREPVPIQHRNAYWTIHQQTPTRGRLGRGLVNSWTGQLGKMFDGRFGFALIVVFNNYLSAM